MLFEDRRRTVTAAGCYPEHPPAWAFLANPVVKALIELRAPAPRDHRPTDPMDSSGPGFLPAVRGMRLSYVGISVIHDGIGIRLDAAEQMARIRISGEFPESLAATAQGRPLHMVIGMPGMGAGTAAGDSPVRGCRTGAGGLHLTLECPLMPLADPPRGVNTDWLLTWRDGHYR